MLCCVCVLFQIYTHLNNVFELLSKAVVESKQKVNIPKLNKEEPEEKEEGEKPKKEERGTVCILFWLNHFYTHCGVICGILQNTLY